MAHQTSINTGDSNLDAKIIEWLEWNKVQYYANMFYKYIFFIDLMYCYILRNIFIKYFLHINFDT